MPSSRRERLEQLYLLDAFDEFDDRERWLPREEHERWLAQCREQLAAIEAKDKPGRIGTAA